MKNSCSRIVFVLSLLISNAIQAAVVSVSGTVVLETNPFPPESSTQVFVFNEQQNIPFVSTQELDFGSIAAGTLVNSHYVQYDPIGSGFVGTGSVTFDGPVLGVITSTSGLTADLNSGVSGTSDTYFGLETVLGAYPAGADPSSRGLGSPEDDLVVNIGENTLVIDSLEVPPLRSGNLDGFRVLTAVPLPPAIWLFSFGLLSLIGISRRKNGA